MRYLLFIPALIFFLMPFAYAIHQSAVARRAANAKEEKRRAAVAAKEAAARDKQAAKEARAANLRNVPIPARKRGRPRKHQAPTQMPEIILDDEALT